MLRQEQHGGQRQEMFVKGTHILTDLEQPKRSKRRYLGFQKMSDKIPCQDHFNNHVTVIFTVIIKAKLL